MSRGILTVPLSLKDANNYIEQYHRHHGAVQGYKFAIGAEIGGKLCGVCVCGRPVSRNLDNGETLEVTRLCSDGSRNVCSFLYSKAARIAKEMGYKKIITYILETENGASLKAAGWYKDGDSNGGAWNRPSRPRELQLTQLSFFPDKVIKYPICKKQRWTKAL